MEEKTKTINRLWLARRRAGLEQKQVARLLGHKSSDQISRYERGVRVPSFQTALKLEIIYRASIKDFFPELYRSFKAQIERLQLLPTPESDGKQKRGSADETLTCTALDLLVAQIPKDQEIELVRNHTVDLSRKLSDAIDRKKSHLNDLLSN